MGNRLSVTATLLLLVVVVANSGVIVVGLTQATGPARKAFWVVAVFQCLLLIASAAVAGWMIARRYAGPRRPDSAEADYHDPNPPP